MIKRFNESVNIFTKLSVILDKTIKLPNFPDILPRVVTIVEVKLKDNNITVLNTHLSAYSKKVKKRQLKCLLKIIKSINTPLILTGDFNMDIKSDILNKFIFELNNLGIRHLEIKGKTFKNSKETLPIDHIFISNCLTFESLEKIKDEELSFSDHYPILMKLK